MAINRPSLALGVLLAEAVGLCLWDGVGDCAAFRAASEGCDVGGVRVGPDASSEALPLVHLALDLLDLLRLLLRACFCGVVGPLEGWPKGSESLDECEVNSACDSAVEEPELAVAFACVGAGTAAAMADELAISACERAPLSGGAG